MNESHFLGRMIKAPELKQVNEKTCVVNFTIAINKKRKNQNGELQEETAFLDMEAWDSGAETIAQYFDKGDPIIVHASAKTDSWTTPEGQKRSKIKFRVNKFEFVEGSKKRAAATQDEDTQSRSRNDSDVVPDEEVPF